MTSELRSARGAASEPRRRAGGRTEIGGRAFQFEPHHCFACGELNEHGLHLDLHTGPTGCRTELVLPDRFQGWEGVAHGGILATILDEVMAWSVIGRGTWGVTARMTVDFKRPVNVGTAIVAEGHVDHESRRLIRTTGVVRDARTGELLASAEGTYMAAPPERLDELKARYRLRPADDRAAPGAAPDAAAGAANRADPPGSVDR